MERVHTLVDMNSWKSTSLVLVGIVVGFGYAIACGGGSDDGSSQSFGAPGVSVANAQSMNCTSWQVGSFPMDLDLGDSAAVEIATLPEGYLPLGATPGPGGSSTMYAIGARCAP